MAKIKLTKSELKRQRDSLKQFQRYLPTLQLKKQQLQMKILEVRRDLDRVMVKLFAKEQDIHKWYGLLADKTDVDIPEAVTPKDIVVDLVNIAGAKVPVFMEVIFPELDYDYYSTPFWLDEGIASLREYISFLAQTEVIRNQIAKLERELRTTTQRVNLFEKVKIPECQENIRVIRIYLGDQQANAVGVSKVAKKKVEQRSEEETLV